MTSVTIRTRREGSSVVEITCAATTSKPLFSSGFRELVKDVPADLEAPRAEVAEGEDVPEEDAPATPEGGVAVSPSKRWMSKKTTKMRRTGTWTTRRATAMRKSWRRCMQSLAMQTTMWPLSGRRLRLWCRRRRLR